MYREYLYSISLTNGPLIWFSVLLYIRQYLCQSRYCDKIDIFTTNFVRFFCKITFFVIIFAP